MRHCGHFHTSDCMSLNLLIIKPNLWGKPKGIPSPTPSAHPISFRLVLMAFENFEYPWDAKASGFLLLCFLNGLQALFRVKQAVKNIVQRPAPGLDSCEWLGVWDSMGKYLGQWTPPMIFKLTPGQVQNADKLVKYLQNCAATLGTPERHKSPQCAGVWPTPTKPCSTWFSALKGNRGETKQQALRLHCLPSRPCSLSSPASSHSPPNRQHHCRCHWHCPGFSSGHCGCSSSSSGSRHRG